MQTLLRIASFRLIQVEYTVMTTSQRSLVIEVMEGLSYNVSAVNAAGPAIITVTPARPNRKVNRNSMNWSTENGRLSLSAIGGGRSTAKNAKKKK
jgi:hypothetical protein